MSLEESPRAEVASLRAVAHPLRLQMLSLLTGAAMSAAEVARELGVTHANASYHLRQLHAAGLLDVAEEVAVRGGKARRYRHDADVGSRLSNSEEPTGYHRTLADELIRRGAQSVGSGPRVYADAELWVDPDTWQDVCGRVGQAMFDLHKAARPPRTAGAVRTSSTVAMFGMTDGTEARA